MFEQESAQLQERIEAIQKQYQPRIDALQRRGEEMEDGFEKPSTGGAVIGVDFEVDWKQTDIVVSVPSVTVRDKKIVVSLPEVTSKPQKIAFDVPEVIMVPHVLGRKPEIHGTTIKWTNIIVSRPETRMRRKEFITDVPQVTMKTKEFVVGIPEFKMSEQRLSLKLPQFKVTDVSASIDEIQDEGEALEAEGQELGKSMQAAIELEVSRFQKIIHDSLYATQVSAGRKFDSAFTTINNAMADLQAKGCDPIKVPTESGDINLRKIYQDVVSEKTKVDAAFDAVIAN